jgi:hypothetical protein
MEFERPKRIPEANIQAEIYKRLKELGIESILEYKFKEFKLRADLIIIKNDEIICACEIKSWSKPREINSQGKQFQKYLKLGIPVFYCGRFEKIDYLIKEIIELYNKI